MAGLRGAANDIPTIVVAAPDKITGFRNSTKSYTDLFPSMVKK